MNEELTPLQALARIRKDYCLTHLFTYYGYELDLIETALKALEIIKTYYDIDEKGQLLHKVRYVWHKDSVHFDYELKEKRKEIELLKEILDNGR